MPDPSELLHAPHLRRAWRVLLLLTMAVVSWFAFMPDSGGDTYAGADKVNHLLAFGTLGLLAALCAAPGARAALLAAVALLAYGGFIEGVQSLLPSRHAEWTDLVADATGIVLGLLAAAALRRAWPAGRRRGGPGVSH